MGYTSGNGTYHLRQRCRRLHSTGRRIRQVEPSDEFDACPNCVEQDETEEPEDICTAELSTGDGICGRELPCPYHDQ